MKNRVVCLLLALVLTMSVCCVTASAIVAQNPVHTESGTVEGKEDAFPAIRDALTQYQVGQTQTMADDGYIGISVDITVYNDPDALPTPTKQDELERFWETTEPNPVSLSKTGKPLILYVINTNTVRYGTDSDVNIITDLLGEGYVVMVVDYKNEKRSATPDLDWSLQLVRTKYKDYTGSLDIWDKYNYILPAGYSIKRGVQFFNYEQSAVDGILEYFMEVWNIDLKRTTGDYARGDSWKVIWGQKELLDGTLVYQDSEGNRCIPYEGGYAYYTQNEDYSYTVGAAVADPSTVTPLYKKVSDDAIWVNASTRQIKIRYAIAEDYWDCVKPNGDRIDFNLYSDIYYPTNPEGKVPVMMLASSSELRASATQTATRPISTGFMFTGYAFVNYDHAYTPMSRTDHFGYFEGEDSRRTSFTVRYQTGIQAQTAAVRQVRALAEAYPELFALDLNAIGVWGHSKGAAVNVLGTQHPELQPNEGFLPGHSDECSGTQQWLTYTDGTPIPSNVQLVYTSNGGGTSFIYPDNVPTVVTQGEEDGSFSNNTHYAKILGALRALDVPALDMSMEGVGHTTIYGYNEERDYDMYQALFDFVDYHLYGRAAVCEYILPKSGTRGVDVKDDIIIKFTGSIPESEIQEKVKVVNARTGEFVDGIWESAFCRNEWTFKPMGLEGGTVYTVIVPETLTDDRGNAIKARKTISFRTAYDTAFSAAEVISTDGSFTLVGTEGAENGVFFVFDPINVTHNIGTVLRFSVRNKAATALCVYGVSSYNKTNPEGSVLTAPLATVGVADSEIVEVNVSEYVASLSSGEAPVFYVEAVKSAGESTLFESDLNEADSRGVFAGQTFAQSPNGSAAMRIKMGGSASVNLFPSGITESDYGRLITVTFDAYATIDRPLHTCMRLNSDLVLDNGKYYVDFYNDAYTVAYLKAGEWNTITLTYRIDDYDYVNKDSQKTKFFISVGGESMSDEFVYVDNIRITETVIDATVAQQKGEDSIAPTLAIKEATLENAPLTDSGYVTSGKYENESFGTENGYLVSGKDSGMINNDTRISYLCFDIEELALNRPYALTLNILSGEGVLRAYVIDPEKIPSDFDMATLTYLNAPGLDRTTGDIAKDAIFSSLALGEREVRKGDDCQFGLTRSLLDLKTQGEKTMLIAIVAVPEKTSGTISFTVKSGSVNPQTTINLLDFDNVDSFFMATRRAENTYDVNDIHMQGTYLEQEAMEQDGISASSEIYYGDSGKSMKITVPTGNNNVYKLVKLIDSPERVFTESDIGKVYHISFRIYLTNVPSAGFNIGLASVGAGSYDGSAASKVHQKVKIEGLTANQWHSIDYTFTVDELMVGKRTSKLANDTRCIHFAIQGLKSTVMYLDDVRYYSVEEADSQAPLAPSRTENHFESSADAKKVGLNGFESIKDESGQVIGSRVGYSTLDNCTKDGSGALRVLHNKGYNRLFVTDLLSTANMTADNIGDSYTLLFRVKADRAGKLLVDVGKSSHGTNIISGFPTLSECVISNEDVGKWLTFSYTFTLNQAIVDDIAAGNNNLFGYRIRFNGFGARSDGTVETTLFFDDMVCYRNAPENGGSSLAADQSVTTSQSSLTEDGTSVGTTGAIEGVRKSYFAYDLTNVRDIHRAIIALKASEHQGQTFLLYALENVEFPEELTFANAPASGTDVKMLLENVFGGTAIADFTFDANGTARIDVSDYICECIGGTAIFAVISEQGSMCYLGLDFSLIDTVPESLFTSDGELTVREGKLSVSGTSLTVKNAFASTEAILPAKAPVTVRVKVTADQTFTLKVDGTDLSATKTATDGIVEFTFTPSVDTKVSSVSITADTADFAVLGIEIMAPSIAKLDAPSLELYTPKIPVYDFEGAIAAHNMMIGEGLSYNLYLAEDKGIVSVAVDGKTYAFTALRELTVAGSSYRLLTLDTVAKDAFRSHTVTLTLENGECASFDINVSHYLEQFYGAAASETERDLAASMISYLAASAQYFYAGMQKANAASAVRNTVLGFDYDEKHTVEIPLSPINSPADGGMQGAGLMLGERPVFYFVAAEGYENEAPTFTIGGEVVRYTAERIDGKVYFTLIHSPDLLDQSVSYTIGEHSGTFNLRAYYDWAKSEGDTALVHLVERLYAYNQSIHACFE